MDFISRLLDLLFPPRNGMRVVRETSLESLYAHLAPQSVPCGAQNAMTLAPFRTSPLRILIHEAKYKENARAQELLGGLLAHYIKEWLPHEPLLQKHPVVFVPIPLSRSRRRERGFNQCEVILRYALAQFEKEPVLPALFLDPRALVRTRDTEHQTKLTRAGRAANVAGAFVARQPLNPDALYIVFDDVITTGATLSGALAALQQAGAAKVIPLALAR